MRLRVATWNIHSCVGSDGRYDPARVARVLRAMDADVIGLQEVDWRTDPHEGVDQFAYLARELDMFSVAGPNLADHRGDYGNAMLTRLPVVHAERIDLSMPEREPRGAISARLYHEGRSVHAVVTHLGLRRSERVRQLGVLRAAIAQAPPADARLLFGDMNEWSALHPVTRSLGADAFAAMIGGKSYPSRFPLFSLDRIFADPLPDRGSGGVLRTRRSRIASDHLPLVAELEWRNKSKYAEPQPEATSLARSGW